MTDTTTPNSESAQPLGLGCNEQLGALPVGVLTVTNGPGVACTGAVRRYEPIKLLPDGEHLLYDKAALDAAVAAERERFRAALLDEAAEWTGDFRVPVHQGLCDAAERAGVPLTFDECYQATKRA